LITIPGEEGRDQKGGKLGREKSKRVSFLGATRFRKKCFASGIHPNLIAPSERPGKEPGGKKIREGDKPKQRGEGSL